MSETGKRKQRGTWTRRGRCAKYLWHMMYRQLPGLRFALRILCSGLFVWLILSVGLKLNPQWGLISTVIVTNVKAETAWMACISRVMNTLIGAVVGLGVVWLLGTSEWSILVAMAISTVISADVVRVPVSWRIAPVTAVIVACPAYWDHSSHEAMSAAGQRVLEVLVGSIVAVLVSYLSGRLLHRKHAMRRAGKELNDAPGMDE